MGVEETAPPIFHLAESSSQPMNQQDQAKKQRGCRYCAQQEQRRQVFLHTEAANAAAQSGYIPGMLRILQMRAAGADHTV